MIICKICERPRRADLVKSGVCSSCERARVRSRHRETPSTRYRRCHGCKDRKPLSDFPLTGGHWTERSMWCRDCGTTAVREEALRLDEEAQKAGPDPATAAAWERLRANREAAQS